MVEIHHATFLVAKPCGTLEGLCTDIVDGAVSLHYLQASVGIERPFRHRVDLTAEVNLLDRTILEDIIAGIARDVYFAISGIPKELFDARALVETIGTDKLEVNGQGQLLQCLTSKEGASIVAIVGPLVSYLLD